MSIPKKIWLGALGGAVGVHLGIAILILSQSPESGAQNFGVQGIEIGLETAGGMAGEQVETAGTLNKAEAQEVIEEPPTEEAAQTVAPAEAIPEPVEPMATPEVLPEPVQEAVAPESVEIIAERAAAEEIADTVPVTEPPVTGPPEPEIVEQIADIVTEVMPVPRRKPRAPRLAPPEPVPAALPKAEPVPDPAPAIAEPAPAPSPITAPASQASLQGNQGITGAGNTQNTGSGIESSAGGTPGMLRDYTAYLQAWLERHKQYPRRARLRRQQGTALLHFEVDRDGNVLSYEIRESSGYRSLDNEVAKMIERAQPLPEFPVEMTQARLKILVPISFAIH